MHGTGGPLGRYSSEVPLDAQAAARQVAAVLAAAGRVLVLGHVGADGDVVGSSLGLALALREQGKEVTLYNERPYGELYDWLTGAETLVTTLAADAVFDATVVVDAADPARCGADFPGPERRGCFIWMDHHRVAVAPGDLNYVDLTAAAVGEQVAEVLDAMGHPLSLPVAEALYTSLMSDTGGFRYANTSARALRLASRLVACGVDPWRVTQQLYESQDEARVRLLGRVLDTLTRSPCGRLGVVTVTEEDMRVARADEQHIHGIVNHVRGVRGVEVAVLLREQGEATGVIMRSRGNVSLREIAEQLGARGHANAATFRLQLPLEEATRQVSEATVGAFPLAQATPSVIDAVAQKCRAPAARSGRRRGGRRSPSASASP